jgi:hypothetical protein
MSLDDIMSWGGRVIYTAGMPNRPDRLGAVARGEPDAVLDEALPVFAREAIDMGMRFLAVDGPQLKMLEADGLMRAAITDEEYPSVGETIWMVDFSGWPLFCLAGAPDEMIYNFCAGWRRARITSPGMGKVRCRSISCARTAWKARFIFRCERFWRECGYLP